MNRTDTLNQIEIAHLAYAINYMDGAVASILYLNGRVEILNEANRIRFNLRSIVKQIQEHNGIYPDLSRKLNRTYADYVNFRRFILV